MKFLLIGIAVFAALLALVLRFSEKLSKFEKIAIILFEALSFITLYLPDRWSESLDDETELLWGMHDPVFSLLHLIGAAMLVLLPVAIFFKRKNFARLSVIAGIPCYLANCFYFTKYITYYCYESTQFSFGAATEPVVTNVWFRGILFAAIEILKLFLILQIIIKQKDSFKFKSFGDVMGFIGLSIPLLFVNMPAVFPSQFTGVFTDICLSSANWVDFAWLFLIVSEIVILALVFKNRSDEDKYILFLVLAISLLFQFNNFFLCKTPITIKRLPMQLCNMACFFIPIAVFLREKRLCSFITSINVFGAIVAWIVCDTPGSDGLFYVLNVHYIVTHSNIIIIGMLMLILGFVAPLDKKKYFQMLKVYSLYFLFALTVGTVFNSIAKATGNDYFDRNFLFMFDREFGGELLPFLAKTFDIGIHIGPYVEFTLIELIMYLALGAIGTGFFFLFKLIFKNVKPMELDNIGR